MGSTLFSFTQQSNATTTSSPSLSVVPAHSHSVAPSIQENQISKSSLSHEHSSKCVGFGWRGCACQFVLCHGGYAFNILDPNERENAVQYLMYNVWVQCTSESVMIKTCTALHPFRDRIECNAVAFQLVQDPKPLSHALSSIRMRFETTGSSDATSTYHHGLRNILDILIHNPLIIKHFFRSTDAESCNIWQNLMFCLIFVLSFDDIPLLTLRRNDIDHRWFELYSDFASTIKYWQTHHLIYFIENGFCVLIQNVYARFTQYTSQNGRPKDLCDAPLLTSWAAFNLYSKVLSRCKRMDRMHDTNVTSFFKRTVKEFINDSNYYHLMKDFRATFHSKSMLKDRSLYCGYTFCNKIKKSFGRKNKCKGCKMIQYCCRKHQKIHWKMIHSQQCKLITSFKQIELNLSIFDTL